MIKKVEEFSYINYLTYPFYPIYKGQGSIVFFWYVEKIFFNRH